MCVIIKINVGICSRRYIYIEREMLMMAQSKAKSASKKGGEAKKKSTMSKSHVIISVLASLAFSFSFFIVGPLSFFFSEANRGFFEDNNIYAHLLIPVMVIAAVVFFVLLAAILILASGKVHTVLISIITWLLVCGYIQTLFFNGWTQGLIGDGNAGVEMPAFGIPNLILWLALGVIIIGAPLLSKGKLKKVAGIAKMVVVYLLVLVFAMQGAGLLEVVLNAPEEKESSAFLSTENMFDISSNDNVVVFVIDRFDYEYYKQVLAADPTFFDDFDGFTSYVDNISLYARTYPAVTSMLTGIENDFEGTREEYFEEAYSSATFLKDMAAGGYDINLYTSNWYVYNDANDMGDIANAIDAGDAVQLDDPMGLLSAMISYSTYNFCPDVLKPAIGVSTKTFVGFASQNTDYEMYAIDDAKVYSKFASEGLTEKGKNNFTLLHLRGCHSPYNVDENCVNVGDGNSDLVSQTTGVFKLIREYIAELKAKGVYEDATIIITGDHANPVSDTKDVEGARVTALLVKEKGQAGTAFKESEAPVSQANFIPTIIKSTGVTPSVDYGKAYSEVAEDETVTRKYLFERTVKVDGENFDEIVEYEITGSARDFSNWKIKERHQIGKIYK